MQKRPYTLGVGKYYFQLKMGQQNILIYRESKKAATEAYLRYKRVGKNCEWLGKWDGKAFEDKVAPKSE